MKTAVDAGGQESHTVYALETLELRRATYTDDAGYERSAVTEVPYLLANGVRLARVVHHAPNQSLPEVGDDGIAAGIHVLLELGDHLGSTNVVLDLATGELVERSTFYAYGATESDYRPDRWGSFREDYRFTGKEQDVEVGLTYFGKRYLNAYLGRWVSADPLGVHGLGGADLNLYAYVTGQLLKSVDPVGLQATEADVAALEAATADAVDAAYAVGNGGIAAGPSQNMTAYEWADPATHMVVPLPQDKVELHWVQSAPDPIEQAKAALTHKDPEIRVQAQLTLAGAGAGVVPYAGDYASAFTSLVKFGAFPSWDNALDLGLDGAGAALPFVPALGTIRSADRLTDALDVGGDALRLTPPGGGGGGDYVDLYRAVGPEEYYDIQKSGMFKFGTSGPDRGMYEAKMFGLDFDETLRFADTDPQYAAIMKARVPRSTADALHATDADRFIFRSGVRTANDQAQLDLVNSTIVGGIVHRF